LLSNYPDPYSILLKNRPIGDFLNLICCGAWTMLEPILKRIL
jgi:hypothetical protein